MCDFDTLYFGTDGYVARCKECDHYQVAFITTVLTLKQHDFNILRAQVAAKYSYAADGTSGCEKNILITTPSQAVQICLTKAETLQFSNMLEEADNESKTLALLSLFNK